MLKNLHLLLFTLFFGNLLLGQVKNPISTASTFLNENYRPLKLTATDIANFRVSSQVVSKHNKLTHLYLQQQHEGIPVYNAIFNFNIKADGEVLSYGNRFVENLAGKLNTQTPELNMKDALSAFLGHFNIAFPNEPIIAKEIDARNAVFEHQGLALEPIPVSLLYQPMQDGTVRLAWSIKFYELNGQHWWSARIDAITGEVLDYNDLVLQCNFGGSAAACADPVHRHAPEFEWSSPPVFTPVTTEGDASYRVFPIPVESPNHGERILVVDPADTLASPFGWHDTNGEEGPEYTITRGNNVHAYHDIFRQNESTGKEPDGGDTLCFDYPLDLSTNRPYTQHDPLVTNLFYWNNLMHDLWYHYGFDEAAGNFQALNYTGEGADEDYVRAEALDGAGLNNANFATPTDGQRPRMQMFIWGQEFPEVPEFGIHIVAPDSLAGIYNFEAATFGAALPSIENPITGQVVLVDDGEGIPSDGCQPFLNAAAIEGKIAMLNQGGACQNGTKILAAEQAGAIAVILCNNMPGEIFPFGPGTDGGQVTIPSIILSLQDCNRLKLGLPDLEVSLFDGIPLIPDPGPMGRSSDLDNGVIVHEYTHGISNRLTGGANQDGCLNNFEQAGEGWSDWFGLVMTNTPEMTADLPRGIGTYAGGQPTTGDGIRTYPYTRDMSVNPHTYADINSESRPHGIGSVWCAMIWDLFWNLVDVYGYDEDLYEGTGGNNMAMQLVLDGMKLQPCDPSFPEARDAILLADSMNYDGANHCLIWETFARRGLGASAVQGGTEAFDLPRQCVFTFNVEKSAPAEIGAGDTVTYVLDIYNGRVDSLEQGIVMDQLPPGMTFIGSSDCSITEDNGMLTIDAGGFASGETKICTYQVKIDATPFTATGFFDGVEMGPQHWTFENPIGSSSWGPKIGGANNGAVSLFASNPEVPSDQQLRLQVPVTLSGTTPALSFWHRYDTEVERDGGVVEISTDGNNWEDLGPVMIQNGYPGSIAADTENPLSGRMAFHGRTNGWIETIANLSAYSGEDILIRFRFGSDEENGGEGWYVDDVTIFSNYYSLSNTACTEDEGELLCSEATSVVYEEVVSGIEAPVAAVSFSIFPNPTTGEVNVRLNDQSVLSAAQIRVFSMDGRLLFEKQYDTFRSAVLEIGLFGAGMYLIQLQTESGTSISKVVVR